MKKALLIIMWVITLVLMGYSYYLVNYAPYWGPLHSQIDIMPQFTNAVATISILITIVVAYCKHLSKLLATPEDKELGITVEKIDENTWIVKKDTIKKDLI